MKKKHLLIRTSAAVLSAAMIAGTTPVSAAASEDFEAAEEIEAVDLEESEVEENDSEESEVEEVEESEAEEPETGEAEESEAEEPETGEAEKSEAEEPETGEAEKSEAEEPETEVDEKIELEEPESGENKETGAGNVQESEAGEIKENEFEEFEEIPVVYNGDGTAPALIAADGYSILDVEAYLKSISFVSVDGEEHEVTAESSCLILANGKLNTAAKPFECGDFFEIQVEADGYPELEFVYWVGGAWDSYDNISIPLIDDVNHTVRETKEQKSSDSSVISRETYQLEHDETVTWGYRVLRKVRVSEENINQR